MSQGSKVREWTRPSHKALTYKNKGPIVVGGATQKEEDPTAGGDPDFAYTFSTQVWKGNPVEGSATLPATPTATMKKILSEVGCCVCVGRVGGGGWGMRRLIKWREVVELQISF
jgi:hypothetical protein